MAGYPQLFVDARRYVAAELKAWVRGMGAPVFFSVRIMAEKCANVVPRSAVSFSAII